MEEYTPPRVTALVVVRNAGAQLRKCLAALEQSADRSRLEILVVDDGSRDETGRVPDDFPDVISLKMPKRLGYVRATNIGLRTARGELIYFTSVWDEVQPETIPGLADRLDHSPDVGAVCPRVQTAWTFPSPDVLLSAWRDGELAGARPLSATEEAVDYPKGAPIMVPRELLRAMNYLDQRFGDRWADLEMCSRIRDGGKKILVLADVPVTRTPPVAENSSPLETMDSANGIGRWVGLHHGFAAGLRARLGMAFQALGRGQTSVFTGVLTGRKIDGNQE